MDNSLARLISIAGHPGFVLPVAAVIASPSNIAGLALYTSLACGALIVAYSFYKVRRRQWTHIDASVPSERAQLNFRAGTMLIAAAGLLWLTGLHMGIPIVVGLSGLIVILGYLLRRFAKLSLHVAFAVFAVFLVWPNPVAAVGFAIIALAVAWSRIALGRHVAADLVLGALAGSTAGLALHFLIRSFAA